MQTEVLWRAAPQLGVPRMVFVNKEDKERADFHRVLEQLRGPRSAAASRRWSCRSARRRRSTAWPTCSPTRPSTTSPTARITPSRCRPTSRTRSTRCTTSSSRRSSRATTSSSSATCRGDVPTVDGAGAHAGPRGARRPRSSRCCSARRSPASASTAWPTSSARSARRPPTGRSRSTPATAVVDVAADAAGQPLAFVFKTIADPVRRPALAVQGAVRARSRPTTSW